MKVPFSLDPWQREVLDAEGNLCICCGRQVGKSTVIGVKAGEYVAKHPNRHVVIVSVTEDQAEMMLQKVLIYLSDNYPKLICKGRKKPTKHVLHLNNGAVLRTKAVGQQGTSILGMTVDVLIADEAAYMPEATWVSATPMLLTTGGQIWLLSTPNAQSGYFYEAYTNRDLGFKTFHVNSEQVAVDRPEPLRSMMLSYLSKEKRRMTALQYAQQYLAQFLEEQGQFFPDELIRKCQTLKRLPGPPQPGAYFLGMDVARMGGDETTYEVLERSNKVFYHRENLMYQYTQITDTIAKVLEIDKQYGFIKIYIDEGGIGVAVYDHLLQLSQTKRKIVPINNARRSLDRDDTTHRKLLKEDLYHNMKRMMEAGELFLLDDDEVFVSLKSIIIEQTPKKGYVKIYGRYSHIAEGLIRACWAVRNTHLNIYFGVS